MNLIKINGEKEWDKSQYEYSLCLYASAAHIAHWHWSGDSSRARRSLLPSIASHNAAPGAPQTHLGAAPALPCSLSADGRWEAAGQTLLGKQPVPRIPEPAAPSPSLPPCPVPAAAH